MTTLPAHRFKRPTLLIVGCGDVGLRVLKLLRGRWRVLALTTDPARIPELRAAGAVALLGAYLLIRYWRGGRSRRR